VPNKAFIRLAAQRAARPQVRRVLTETLTLSKRYVPVRNARPYDKRPTGRLKRSLRSQGPIDRVWSVTGRVGTTLRYATAVHEGAQPHRITARYRPRLVFFWTKKGTVFTGFSVNHPGVRPSSRTQYLYLPLVLVGRRHGFIVRRVRTLSSNLP
jgi:hypothetical protein